VGATARQTPSTHLCDCSTVLACIPPSSHLRTMIRLLRCPPHPRPLSRGVTTFAVGDSVIADLGLCETCLDPAPAAGNCGAFAEYAVVSTSLAVAAAGLEEANAVALPLAGLTALQALFTRSGRSFTGATLGDLKAGQKLLILGRVQTQTPPRARPRRLCSLPLCDALHHVCPVHSSEWHSSSLVYGVTCEL
jgi:hypothetical protein